MKTPVDVEKLYQRFFELGGAPEKDVHRPWHYRRRETSLRLAGARFMAAIVRERRPTRVLDLGSGLTSILLRSLAVEIPTMVVTTTDQNWQWLERTKGELKRDGLDGNRCFLQDDFEKMTPVPFGLISVDIGNTFFRIDLAARLQGWLATGGVIVLDDWGMEFTATMTATLEAKGFVVTPRPETVDECGLYLATAERAK